MSRTFERQLGPIETSYFLPSRELGVNDMYRIHKTWPCTELISRILHLGFKAPVHLMGKRRVALSWAILRARHPLLASSIKMHDYDDIRFVFASPASSEDSLRDANDSIRYLGSIDILDYLNGHRVLSDTRLSFLCLTHSPGSALPSPPVSPSESTTELSEAHNYDIIIAATHYIGDGMSLHALSNDFFSLLGNESLTDNDLMSLLQRELCDRWWGDRPQGLPPSLEDQLPRLPPSTFRRLAARVDFHNSQRQQIGGHIFPKRNHGPRSIVIRRNVVEEERTKKMLKTCKSHGVSISSALFALCNITWAKTCGHQLAREMPL